jgi:hypothetical protein
VTALDLAVDAVAAYRLTRLVTADVLTQELRGRVIAHAYGADRVPMPPPTRTLIEGLVADGVDELRGDFWDVVVAEDTDPPKLATLVTCRWCAGMWVAAGVTVARMVAPRPWRWVARGLTVAAAAALFARAEDD